MKQKIFRVFISSTFSDYQEEREVLHEMVFPKLTELAATYGLTFEAVDLRWGISEAAQTSHSTLAVCLEEIQRCQKLSPSPNFVVMLGNRYGWEPAKPQIPNSEMAALMAVATLDEKQRLLDYYREDLNSYPESIWILLPYSEWGETQSEKEILNLSRELSGKSNLPPSVVEKYHISATHHEIAQGLFHESADKEKVCVYFRQINDLEYLSDDVEFRDSNLARDILEHPNLSSLRNSIEKLSPKPQISLFQVDWNDIAKRQEYLLNFAQTIFRDLSSLMSEQVKTQVDEKSLPWINEGLQTVSELAQLCFERDEEVLSILKAVEDAINGHAPRVIYVEGGSGVGKSMLISKALKILQDDRKEAQVIPIFVNETPGAENLSEVLAVIENYLQLASQNSKTARDRLEQIFHNDSETVKVILLDGIDKFSPTSETLDMSYLPDDDFDQGVLIISADQKNLVSEIHCEHQRISVMPFQKSNAINIVKELLSLKHRQLTDTQLNKMEMDLPENSSGLYLYLLANQLLELRSWEDFPVHPQTESGLIARLVSMLASDEKHGDFLVRRAFAYLAASREGLSESEIQKALAIDRLVIDEFNKRAKQNWDLEKNGVLPPIIWSRLRSDLEPYLVEKYIHGNVILDFKYDLMKQNLAQRFVSILRNMDIVTHGALTYVFSPPLVNNNWKLFLKDNANNPRVLRSLSEYDFHYSHLYLPAEQIAIREGDLLDSSQPTREIFEKCFDWISASTNSLIRLRQFLTKSIDDKKWNDTDFLACQLIRYSRDATSLTNLWFSPLPYKESHNLAKILAFALYEAKLGSPIKMTFEIEGEFADRLKIVNEIYAHLCEAVDIASEIALVELFESLLQALPFDNLIQNSSTSILEIARLLRDDQIDMALGIMNENASIENEFIAITKFFYCELLQLRISNVHKLIPQTNLRASEFANELYDSRNAAGEVLAHGTNPNSMWLAALACGERASNRSLQFSLALNCLTAGGTRGLGIVVLYLLELGRYGLASEILDFPSVKDTREAAELRVLILGKQLRFTLDNMTSTSLNETSRMLVNNILNWMELALHKQAQKAAKLGSSLAYMTLAQNAMEKTDYREALRLYFEAFGRGATLGSAESISAILENYLGIWPMNVHWIHRRIAFSTYSGENVEPLVEKLHLARDAMSQDGRLYASQSAISINFGKELDIDTSEDAQIYHFLKQYTKRWPLNLRVSFQESNSVLSARKVVELAASSGDTWAMIDLARYSLENQSTLTAKAWVDLALDTYDSAGVPFLIAYFYSVNNIKMVERYVDKWQLSISLQQGYIDDSAFSRVLLSAPKDEVYNLIQKFGFSDDLANQIHDAIANGEAIAFQ